MQARPCPCLLPITMKLSTASIVLFFCSLTVVVAAPAAAQTQVKVMPGYPNAPRVAPAQRHQARPGADVVLWGNVDDGSLSGLGGRYEWILTLPDNVQATTDDSLMGIVVEPSFIFEEVQFELLNGSTREVVIATLAVENGRKGSGQSSVEILVVSEEEFSSSAHVGNLDVNRRIAIQDGLRYLYLEQETDGSWADAQEPVASTAYALWAIHNQGHIPNSNPLEDIMQRSSERGLDFLMAASTQVIADTNAPRATAALGAVMDGVSDMNENGEVISLCTTISPGYAANIALAAVVSSLAPDRVVTFGPLAGRTYRDIVVDCIDWIGSTQNEGGAIAWGGRGGWTYLPNSSSGISDMSINSWAYIAMEGAQEIFGLEVPAWIKKECEQSIAYQMRDSVGPIPFGYRNTNHHINDSRAQATTAAGLTGIALVLTGEDPGSVLAAKGNANVLTLEDQRSNALACIGEYWQVDGAVIVEGGLRGNYYSMWTVARGLRATAASLGLSGGEVVALINDGVSFNWETGAENGGTLATLGPREGLFSWLVRNQQVSGDITERGRWFTAQYTNRPQMATALALLTLSRRVFLDPCPSVVSLPIASLSLEDGATFADGVPFVFSGQVEPQSLDRPIAAVFVNGREADSLDVEGRFFAEITLLPGPNAIEIEAFDSCGADVTMVTLNGTQPGDDVESFADVTPWLDARYSGTTFNQAEQILAVQVELCSEATSPIVGPILMVFDNFDAPGVEPAFADGVLPDGRPYFTLLGAADAGVLEPGGCTEKRQVYFRNPGQAPFQFRVSWLAPSDSPPVFVTSPDVKAPPGEDYIYSARAVDAQGQEVTYELLSGPLGMSLNGQTGFLEWNPEATDIGYHQVVLEASDGAFGTSQQRWTLEVSNSEGDQPPFFVSAPVTRAAVGSAYLYVAEAVDQEDTDLEYSLLEGPPGLTMDTDGRLEWGFTEEGSYPVRIQVRDDGGGAASQGWLLAVGSVSSNPNAPSLSGNPPVIATVERPYLYQPIAQDLDPDDVLFFELLDAPVGMTVNPATGRVQWTPGSAQIGVHAIELQVDDGQLGVASQAWTVEVFLSPPNAPPVILSVPNILALVGEPYQYQVTAIDPDQDDLEFTLQSAPAGMAIDQITGLITWLPTQQGTVTVAIKVVDGPGASGSFGSQVFTLFVAPPNQAPVIVSSPATEVPAGVTWYYDLNAVDPDGQTLLFEKESGPPGLTVDGATGIARWITSESDLGSTSILLTATDPYGAFDTQSFSLTITEDTEAPTVAISANPEPAAIDEPVTICLIASDDVGVTGLTLALGGADVPLDDNGCATLTPSALGVLDLEASAMDAAGNFSFGALSLQVVDPNDVEAPLIELSSPQAGSTVTGPVEILGTITDNLPGGLIWNVTIQRVGTGMTRVIASGSGNVAGGVLAQFDPTNLPNDTYEVTITADDGVNGARFLKFNLSVAGEFKLGDYGVSFVDAVVPLNGFPIVLGRSYSSLETQPGDFGIGWRLTLPGEVRDAAVEGSNGFEGAYRLDERVYLSLFDGQRRAFRVRLQPIPFFVGAIVSFEPQDGAEGELRLANEADTFAVPLGGGLYTPFDPYNPNEFVYTDPAGVEYYIDETNGLTQIVDVYGGTIDVSPEGLVSSQGPRIDFQRNASGLIELATLPDPNPSDGVPAPELLYTYDSIGRLSTFVDADGVTTTYLYESEGFPAYLTSILDPLGRPQVRNKLDEDGRLIAQCGPDGNLETCDGCLAMDIDAFAEFQTIFTGAGDRIDLFLDDAGRILVERRWLDQAIVFEITRDYDENGFVIVEQESGGATWIFDRNDEGLWTRLVDPAGRTWHRSFSPEGRVESMMEPDGDIYTFGLDENDQLTEIVDPLGQSFRFSYTAFGQLASTTDHEGATWTMTYDASGQPAGFLDPDGNLEQFTYDGLGRLIFSQDRMGQIAELTYTPGGRIATEAWSDGNLISYGYDTAGLLRSLDDSDSALAFEYWPDGRMKSADTSGTEGAPSFKIVYGSGDIDNPLNGYDGMGNVASVLDSFGGQTRYDWDSLRRLQGVEQGLQTEEARWSSNGIEAGRPLTTAGVGSGSGSGQGKVQAKRLAYSYVGADGVDRRVLARMERFGDSAPKTPVSVSEFGYAVQGTPTQADLIRHLDGSGSMVHELTYQRDVEGAVRSWTDAEGLHEVTLDGLKRVTAVDHPAASGLPDESYTYDGDDNRLSSHISATYDVGPVAGEGSDQIRSDNRYDYEHDLNGSLTLRTERSTGATLELDYDYKRRLIAARERDGSGTLTVELLLRYDGIGRKVRSTINGVATYYFYDGFNPIVLADDSGAVLERRLYGREYDELLALERSGEVLWPLKDAVGTVRDWVDSTGEVRFHLVRDSFGVPASGSPQPGAPSIGFQSLDSLGVADLLDVRARSYLPSLGRFTAEDPEGLWGYAGFENNPQIYRDPTGQSVIIEYACLTSFAVGLANSIADAYQRPAANVLYAVAAVIADPSSANIASAQSAASNLVRSTLGGPFSIAEDIITSELINQVFSPNIGCAVTYGQVGLGIIGDTLGGYTHYR